MTDVLWVAMICGSWLAALVAVAWGMDASDWWRDRQAHRRIVRRLRALGAYRRGLAPPLRNASPHEVAPRKPQR